MYETKSKTTSGGIRNEGSMTIHEFGAENKEVLVLIHPSLVMWDYFENVIPLLEKDYHLFIPALPGYDPDSPSDYTSVEQIAEELGDWLLAHGHIEICGVYGCSMGGSIVIRMLTDQRIHIRSAMIDGGITPYQLPHIITRGIAVRDFLMIYMGKVGGIRLLEKAFSADEYSYDNLQYIADVLRMISAKTVWRTFDSCNNYSMPSPITTTCQNVEYWLADSEMKARKWDIAYVRKFFPDTHFRRFKNIGHGGLAVLQPEKFAKAILFVTNKKGAI